MGKYASTYIDMYLCTYVWNYEYDVVHSILIRMLTATKKDCSNCNCLIKQKLNLFLKKSLLRLMLPLLCQCLWLHQDGLFHSLSPPFPTCWSFWTSVFVALTIMFSYNSVSSWTQKRPKEESCLFFWGRMYIFRSSLIELSLIFMISIRDT